VPTQEKKIEQLKENPNDEFNRMLMHRLET